MKRLAFLLAIICCLSVIVSGFAAAAFPESNITLVIPNPPGGSATVLGTTIASIMTEENIIPVNIDLDYKPGGNMMIALAFIANNRGNPHYLMTFTASTIVAPLLEDVGVRLDDVDVPVVFGYDSIVLMTHPDSPFKTFNDVVTYAKANPGKLTIAGSSAASSPHMAWSLLAHSLGIEYTYVPFDGTAPAAAMAMGRQVDLCLGNLSGGGDFMRSGTLRGLAITSSERQSTVPDVPTFVEMGYDFTFGTPRGLFAPADLPEDARQYLKEALTKMVTSERWQKEFVERNDFTPAPLFMDDAVEFVRRQAEIYAEILQREGMELFLTVN